MEMMMVMFAAIIAVGTVFYGVHMMKQKKQGNVKKAVLTSVSIFGLAVVGVFAFMLLPSTLFAAEATGTAAATVTSFGDGLKYVAAALSTGLATMGTGRAVGAVGSSAIGAVSEDSSILGKTLIFVGMAEGIAIYGMIISILILFV